MQSRNHEKALHQFAIDHGFAFKRSQDFKNCMLIKWKLRKIKSGNFVDYERINQKVDLVHQICEKYNLYDKNDLFLDSRLKLYQVGIYSFYEWQHEAWAIPNKYVNIVDYLSDKLPKWVEIKSK